MAFSNDGRLPHSLRIAIFFLRIAIGLNLFYLGWSELFDRALAIDLRVRSIGGLYNWFGGAGAAGGGAATGVPFAGVPATVFAWIFLIVGIFIIIGLFTRLSSIIAAVLVVLSWLPGVTFAGWHPAQFVNDELVIFFALVVLVLAHAGTYIGIDKFIRWRKRRGGE